MNHARCAALLALALLAAACAEKSKTLSPAIPLEELARLTGKSQSSAFNVVGEITPNAPLSDPIGLRSQWRSAVSVATRNIPDALTTDEYGKAVFSSAGLNGVQGELELHILYPQNSYVFNCQVSSFELVAEIPDGAGGVTVAKGVPFTTVEGRMFVSFVWPNADTTKPLVFGLRYDPASTAGETEWAVERCQIIEYPP